MSSSRRWGLSTRHRPDEGPGGEPVLVPTKAESISAVWCGKEGLPAGRGRLAEHLGHDVDPGEASVYVRFVAGGGEPCRDVLRSGCRCRHGGSSVQIDHSL